jgi:hypothetical protein
MPHQSPSETSKQMPQATPGLSGVLVPLPTVRIAIRAADVLLLHAYVRG